MAKTNSWTFEEVARAVRPLPSVFKHISFLDKKRLTRDDVAYFAAFAAVADHEGPIDAATIMDHAISQQPRYWQKAIESAVGGTRVALFVKRYRYNSTAQWDAELAIGPNLESQCDAFADGTQKGSIAGDFDPIDTSAAPPDPVMTIEIGRVIAAALKTLSGK